MYFDHSATSFPKPQELFYEIIAYQRDIGGSPGRGVHETAERAAQLIDIAELLNALDELLALKGVG